MGLQNNKGKMWCFIALKTQSYQAIQKDNTTDGIKAAKKSNTAGRVSLLCSGFYHRLSTKAIKTFDNSIYILAETQ